MALNFDQMLIEVWRQALVENAKNGVLGTKAGLTGLFSTSVNLLTLWSNCLLFSLFPLSGSFLGGGSTNLHNMPSGPALLMLLLSLLQILRNSAVLYLLADLVVILLPRAIAHRYLARPKITEDIPIFPLVIFFVAQKAAYSRAADK